MKLITNRMILGLLLLTLLFSCTRHPMVAGSSVITRFQKCFSNDKLQFSFSTFAPNNLNIVKLQKKDRQLLRQLQINKKAAVLFVGFNDFNHPYHLIGLLESKNFDLSTYERMKPRPETFYYEDVKAKLDTVPMFYHSCKIGKNYIYEAALPFKEYTTRLLYVTDSLMDDKYMSNFNEYGADFSQGSSYAPCSPDDPFTLAAEAFRDHQEVNYLRPLQILSSHRANYQKASEKALFYQAFANYFSLINEQDSADYYWHKLGTRFSTQTLPAKSLQPATPRILQQARQHTFLLFNEAHTTLAHRGYLGSLLDSLYTQGYRYLALEALSQDSTLNQGGLVTTQSGFYTNEPIMGNLIRRAQSIGYRLVSYDNESSRREYEQAKNLYAKTLARDPQAKVVVLAGHGHINESTPGGKKMMATYLREISGSNPLTIDQTTFASFVSPPDLKAGAYIVDPENSQSLTHPDQIQSDLKIYNTYVPADFNNCLRYNQSAPVSITVPADSLHAKQQHILLIYNAAEVKEGIYPVPTALQYLKAENTASAKLCPGKYVAVVKDNLGRVVWRQELLVP